MKAVHKINKHIRSFIYFIYKAEGLLFLLKI